MHVKNKVDMGCFRIKIIHWHLETSSKKFCKDVKIDQYLPRFHFILKSIFLDIFQTLYECTKLQTTKSASSQSYYFTEFQASFYYPQAFFLFARVHLRTVYSKRKPSIDASTFTAQHTGAKSILESHSYFYDPTISFGRKFILLWSIINS